MIELYEESGEAVEVDDGPHSVAIGDECPRCDAINAEGDTALVAGELHNDLGETVDVVRCLNCGWAGRQ